MPNEVTVFVPIMETCYDDEYGPHVYEGRLSKEQVEKVGAKLGGLPGTVQPDLGGYERMAIEGKPALGWYISYSSNDYVEPHRCELGESYQETEGAGALAYHVEYRELNNGPTLD